MRFRHSGVQIILVFMALFTVSALAVLGLVYWQTAQLFQRELDQRVGFEVDRLTQIYNTSGRAAVIDDIQRSAENPRSAVYWFVDENGIKLAGTLDRISAIKASQDLGDGRVSLLFHDQSGDQRLRGQMRPMRAGEQIFVGHDFSVQDQLADSFITSSSLALLAILFMGAFGGWWVAHRTRYRLEEFNRLAERVMEGRLDQRIDWPRHHDEYDHLGDTINRMLDRIEGLVDAMREVGENIAHDLRTPLTRIRHQVELMQQKYHQGMSPSDAELSALLTHIDGVIDTFNALLSLARLETGVTPLEPVSVDLVALASEMVDLYAPVFEEHGARLSFNPDIREAPIMGNPALLQQALANLIENALHYGRSAPDQTVTLSIVQEKAAVSEASYAVYVADQGDGIAPDQMERALRRFGRLDPSRHHQGNGLGLPIVNAIMARHGGRLTLSAQKPHGLKVGLHFAPLSPRAHLD